MIHAPGKYLGRDTGYDLIELWVESVKGECRVKVYADGLPVHGSREKAETYNLCTCHPCKRIARAMASYTEGQFDG